MSLPSSPPVELLPTTSRVFLPHLPMIKDRRTNTLVPKIDLDVVRPFGTPVIVCDYPEIYHLNMPVVYQKMGAALRDFSDNDYILLTGDTFAIAAMVLAASEFNQGRVRMLYWVRFAGEYRILTVDATQFPSAL